MFILALRNLSRQRKRTGIVMSAIGFGVIALLLAGGFIDWIFWGMREGAIHSRLGHIQVTAPDYFTLGSSDPFGYLLPDELDEAELVSGLPDVKVVTPRLAFNGLVSHGDVTIGFTGEGVSPEKESEVSQHLIISKGEDLKTEEPRSVLLGAGLAENLGVGVGDTVALLSTTAGGGLNGVEVTVSGLFHSASKEFDDAALRIPIETARELLRISGSHSLVLLLGDTDRTDDVLRALRDRYPAAASDLQFTPWYELADFYNKTRALLSRQMNIVKLIVAIIIVLSISNNMVMSVVERTGEIGTLMAVGFRRSSILQMFISEGLLLGIVGGLTGVAIGVALAKIITAIGIPMPPPPGMDVGFPGRINASWQISVEALVLAMATTLFGSIYPAWKAARLEVVDALRHNH